jgi:ribosomal protein S18 acetylase RimI-like enzyme
MKLDPETITKRLINAYPQLGTFLASHTLMLYVITNKNYYMYTQVINDLSICDRNVFHGNYENFTYSNLEEDDNIGFFIVNANRQVILSLVLSLDLIHDFENMPAMFRPADYVEVALLCSHPEYRVKYAAKILILALQEYFITLKKPKNMFLHLATKQTGARAFYKSVGFHSTTTDVNVMYTQLNRKSSPLLDSPSKNLSFMNTSRKITIHSAGSMR